MAEFAETIADLWARFSPAFAPTLTLLLGVCFFIGGLLFVLSFSIARIVWLHKHPSWTFQAAFDHLFWRCAIWTPVVALMMAPVWLLPDYLPADHLPTNLRDLQIAVSVAIVGLSSLLFYAIAVERIRTPRE